MNKTKNQLSPLILSVLILSFLTVYFILAFDEPSSTPSLDNIDIGALIIDVGDDQTKLGDLTVDTLTTSGGVLYLHDSTEGNIERVNKIIGADDLFLLSNPTEDGPIQIGGSELNFWSDGLKWQIDSAGILTIGSVPWKRLISAPDDCPENKHVIGMNEDGTFKCSSFKNYCEIIYKCAVSDEEGECIPKAEGEYDLPVCQKCDGISLDPVNYAVNVQDTTGPNICDNTLGDCYSCNSDGNCSFQTSDSDTGDQCEIFDCYTENCSGTGYSCGTYTNGQQNCALCMKCNPNGDGSCVYQTSAEDLGGECPESSCYTGNCIGTGAFCGYQSSGQDLWGACDGISGCETDSCGGVNYSCGTYSCPACQTCSEGSMDCESTEATNWGAGLYGCIGSDKRCYGGVCRTCGGYLYGDGCGGCADQGGKGCWYQGGRGQSCNTVCSSHGGCVSANWNSCNVCDYFWHTYSCCIGLGGSNWGMYFPGYEYYFCGPQWHCTSRSSSTPQQCGAAHSNVYRQCVCQY